MQFVIGASLGTYAWRCPVHLAGSRVGLPRHWQEGYFGVTARSCPCLCCYPLFLAPPSTFICLHGASQAFFETRKNPRRLLVKMSFGDCWLSIAKSDYRHCCFWIDSSRHLRASAQSSLVKGGRFEESFLNFVLQLDLSQGGSLNRTLNRMQWFSGIFDKEEDKVGDKVGQNGCFRTSPSQAFTVDVTVIRDGAAMQGPRLRSPLGYL